MKEQNTAKVYAKTFMELGADKGVDFAAELTNLTEAINASNDLENGWWLDIRIREDVVTNSSPWIIRLINVWRHLPTPIT